MSGRTEELWALFVRTGKVFVPTIAKTEYVVAPDQPGKYGGSEQDNGKRQVYPVGEPVETIVSQLVDKTLGADPA
jgi:hypothetical protein